MELIRITPPPHLFSGNNFAQYSKERVFSRRDRWLADCILFFKN